MSNKNRNKTLDELAENKLTHIIEKILKEKIIISEIIIQTEYLRDGGIFKYITGEILTSTGDISYDLSANVYIKIDDDNILVVSKIQYWLIKHDDDNKVKQALVEF